MGCLWRTGPPCRATNCGRLAPKEREKLRMERLKAQGLGTYQAEYEAELQLGNDPTPTDTEEAT
jgi:hypothetical protein